LPHWIWTTAGETRSTTFTVCICSAVAEGEAVTVPVGCAELWFSPHPAKPVRPASATAIAAIPAVLFMRQMLRDESALVVSLRRYFRMPPSA
jgi:hypothetical protein